MRLPDGTGTFTPGDLEALAALAAMTVNIAVDTAVATTPRVDATATRLWEQRASFVTLHRHTRLRGCIGSLQAWRPLVDDVIANARAAALHDPRFAPVTRDELAELVVDVSVLSAATRIEFDSAEHLFELIRPGTDGLILSHGGRRATYLPSVWSQLPDATEFLASLRRKAGIPDAIELTDITVARYVVEHSPTVALNTVAAAAGSGRRV